MSRKLFLIYSQFDTLINKLLFACQNTHQQYWPLMGKKRKFGKIMVEAASRNFYGEYSRSLLKIMKHGSEVSLIIYLFICVFIYLFDLFICEFRKKMKRLIEINSIFFSTRPQLKCTQ